MQPSPLISFVVPCYNSAQYMRRAIDSILLDGDDPRERIQIILVQDGSTDDTERIAREYGWSPCSRWHLPQGSRLR